MMEVVENHGETDHLKKSDNDNDNDVIMEEVASSSVPSDRLDQIISDYHKVQEAATNEIDRKRRVVRSKCEERLWMAAIWRDYQMEIVKKSFETEIKQIEREHQTEFNNLKEALMQELQEEKKKLQLLEQASSSNLSIDKTGNLITNDSSSSSSSGSTTVINDALTAALMAAEEQAAVASGRRLRRRDEKVVGEGVINGLPTISTTSISTVAPAAVTSASASRRKQVNNIYTYNTMLQEQDILDDLGAIAKEAGSLGTSRRAAAVIKNTNTSNSNGNSTATSNGNSSVNILFEKGVLHYNWDIIGVSDRIRIQMAPNTPAMNATVLSCSGTELIVSTGGSVPARNQIRISLGDLKSGKITILTDDQLLNDN